MNYVEPVIIEKLIYLCYGRGKNKLTELSRRLLKYLDEKRDPQSYSELCAYMGLDPENSGDRVKFRRLIYPLIGNNPLGLHIIFTEKMNKSRYYKLSYESFATVWKNINQQAKSFLEGNK